MKPVHPEATGAETDFRSKMSYGDYLRLERVLDAQSPLSDAHDELLFIIQHQTSELWMKLAIHEIRSAKQAIRENRLQPAFKCMLRKLPPGGGPSVYPPEAECACMPSSE